MIKRLLLMVSVAVIVLPLTLTEASGPNWSVWLYDRESNLLVRVFSDSTTQEIQLVAPQGYDLGEMNFSPDGNSMIICLFPSGGEGSLTIASYDILSAGYRFSYTLQPQESCKVSAGMFSPDGTQFALPSTVSQGGMLSSWAINVIDSASGTILYRLDAASPNLAALGNYTNFSPRVRSFQANEIVLSLQEYFSESLLALMPMIGWQPLTNTVVMKGTYPADMSSTLPNGEMVWLAVDPAFPYPAVETLPGGDANVVMYQDSSGVSYPVFNDANMYLWGVRFIDEGRKGMSAK